MPPRIDVRLLMSQLAPISLANTRILANEQGCLMYPHHPGYRYLIYSPNPESFSWSEANVIRVMAHPIVEVENLGRHLV